MKKLLIGICSLGSLLSLANERPCIKLKSEAAAIANERINGHDSIKAKKISNFLNDGNVTSIIETYTGNGGAVYTVTLEECKVIKVEMLEEIDR